MISTGSNILPADLDNTWERIAEFVDTANSQADYAVFTAIFDGLDSTTTSNRQAYALWVPTTDVRIRGIVVLTADAAHNNQTCTIKLSSLAQGDICSFTASIMAATQTRTTHTTTFTRDLVTVNSGDTMTLRFNAASVATPIGLVRVHVLYESAWDKK